MEKQNFTYSLPLYPQYTFCGLAHAVGQLSAFFQIWARQFGVDDEHSLALWVAGKPEAASYFSSLDKAECLAIESIDKLPKPDGTPIDVAEWYKNNP